MAQVAGGDPPEPDFPTFPSDVELIQCYLQPYIDEGARWPYCHTVEFYGASPSSLAIDFLPALASTGGEAWFFFTTNKKIDKESPSQRKVRAAADGSGSWHSEHAKKPVKDHREIPVGFLQSFSFTKKVDGRLVRSGWLMAELSLSAIPTKEEVVLCKMYRSPRKPLVAPTPPPSSAPHMGVSSSAASGGLGSLQAPPTPASSLPKTSISSAPRACFDSGSPAPGSPLAPPRMPDAPRMTCSPPRTGTHSNSSETPFTPPVKSPLHDLPSDGLVTSPLPSRPSSLSPPTPTSPSPDALPPTHSDSMPANPNVLSNFKHPSDQKLLKDYLLPHIKASHFIHQSDVYSLHPADLTKHFLPVSTADGLRSWYFFAKGKAGVARWESSADGFWRSEYGVKSVFDATEAIGHRELFTFVKSEAGVSFPTGWRMVEIGRLYSSTLDTKIYKIYHSDGGQKRKRHRPAQLEISQAMLDGKVGLGLQAKFRAFGRFIKQKISHQTPEAVIQSWWCRLFLLKLMVRCANGCAYAGFWP